MMHLLLNMIKHTYYNFLYKYFKYYNIYNLIFYILIIITCNVLLVTDTTICTNEKALVRYVPPIVNADESENFFTQLMDRYETYEKFKEFMNLSVIKNTALIHKTEPLSLTYLRVFLSIIEILKLRYDVNNLSELYLLHLALYDLILLLKSNLLHKNIIMNLAILNTELQDPTLHVIIDMHINHYQHLNNLLNINESDRNITDFLVKIEKLLDFVQIDAPYKTPIRTQKFITPFLNEYLHKLPKKELDSNIVIMPEFYQYPECLISPFKLPEGNSIYDYQNIASHLLEDVLRHLRLTSYALGYIDIDPKLLKKIIYNIIKHHQTDYIFWTKYKAMTLIDGFIVNEELSSFFEKQVILHGQYSDELTINTLLILKQIFTEMGDFNLKHDTDFTMQQIMDILSNQN